MVGKVLLANLPALFTDRLNQELLDVIDYLREEVRVLQYHLKKKRPKLVDAQRNVLAVKAKKLSKAIEKYANLGKRHAKHRQIRLPSKLWSSYSSYYDGYDIYDGVQCPATNSC
ncbi:hypothetical protein [Cerasicoccus frondis]|uniref:hypothetical protein n=1 Tax=Cerasicoccus frondis TaxID=490090 RepID=UPI002852C57D|nr:hypothetical protein [Cerasicoccus frondis]